MKLIKSLALAAALGPVSAFAGVIGYGDLTHGAHSVTVDDVTVSAWNNSAQTSAGVFGFRANGPGMGVQGYGNNELDYYGADSEAISFDFTSAASIDSLVLTLLFNGPEYGDYNEKAVVTIDGHVGTLQLTAEDTAAWFVDGSYVSDVASCAPGATQLYGNGCFTISDPFAGALTSNMDLTAANSGGVDESDYLFNSVAFTDSATAVAEPGTVGLLAIGLFSLGLSRRKFAKK